MAKVKSNSTLVTRRLGRTGRFVTTLGLGGQAALMVPPDNADPAAIISKALSLGVSYFDTSNVYGPSQTYFGEAFRGNGLVPNTPNYNDERRKAIFIASKTHMRTTAGEPYISDFSQGQSVRTAVDDVRRSLSQIFGDGQGAYPDGAYLDCIQLHNITTCEEVDVIFEGLWPSRSRGNRVGALAGLLDLRNGTNVTGVNPKKERLVRHIGITGHWSSPALMYAIQRDVSRILDTLLVAINPTDLQFLSHQLNVVPTASHVDMGVIAMKVFAEGVYYGKEGAWVGDKSQLVLGIGGEPVRSAEFIQYALSVPGVDICIIGIGHIDNDRDRCQLSVNLQSAQISKPLSPEERKRIEELIRDTRHANANHYFQRPPLSLTPPRNVGAEPDPQGFSPAIQNPQYAVRISWDAAYAGKDSLKRYDILRDDLIIYSVSHYPQSTLQRFAYRDVLDHHSACRHHEYVVRAIDARGNVASSQRCPVDPCALSPSAGRCLAWRQTQHVVSVALNDVDGLAGRVVGSGTSGGVAFFGADDIATISIQWTVDFQDGTGEHNTYSRYRFEDDSELLIRGKGQTKSGPDNTTATFLG